MTCAELSLLRLYFIARLMVVFSSETLGILTHLWFIHILTPFAFGKAQFSAIEGQVHRNVNHLCLCV